MSKLKEFFGGGGDITEAVKRFRDKIDLIAQQVGEAVKTSKKAEASANRFSNPNMLINGDMAIWQRGNKGVDGYSADRWLITGSTAWSRNAPDSKTLPTHGNAGIRNSLSISGGAKPVVLRQIIENGIDMIEGRPVAFSFWLFGTPDLVGKKVSADVCDQPIGEITVKPSWNRYELKGAMGDLTGRRKFFDSGASWVDINLPVVGKQTTFDISFIKLEVLARIEDSATPFIPDNHAINLAKCQRFYQKGFARGFNSDSSTNTKDGRYVGINVIFPNTMFKQPTIRFGSNENYAGDVTCAGGVRKINTGGAGPNPSGFYIDAVTQTGGGGTWSAIFYDANAEI
ncbi:hypothetical protein [Photobacterium damselae]|uniref:hypothetical protein n=1 Tax=Photobacterium damselae TaxID=38293 RepID=UPI001F2E36CE|nr:hypothetical protein [Photobacterium damselae]UKA12934.1 hypothetical protein IHC91_21350 [Photobacterium damselae subsp. damselae]